jgi:hypothetical protein
MRVHRGSLPAEIMLKFPSGTAAETFPDWVANHVGLEQVLGLAGLLIGGRVVNGVVEISSASRMGLP